jgi:hypothetical protein
LDQGTVKSLPDAPCRDKYSLGDDDFADGEPEFDEFIGRMRLLGSKLGPMLLQFPKFDK